MSANLQIAFFGSSLLSAYWNGAATYYRGMIKALAAQGHQVTFFEPDAYDRQKHRDIPDPDWACVVVYPVDNGDSVLSALEHARDAGRDQSPLHRDQVLIVAVSRDDHRI